MNGLDPSRCGHCGAGLAPGHAVCGQCGAGARPRGMWLALLQAAAGLSGCLLVAVGGCCTLAGLVALPGGVIVWFFTVPILLVGMALVRWAIDSDQAQAGDLHARFGPDSQRMP